MVMKIQTKIILLLSLIIAVFMIGLVFLNHSQRNGADLLFEDQEHERNEFFDKFVKVKGESLETLAFDYTYWDEMVNFLKTHDKTWASQTLDTSLSSYKVDEMWIYQTDDSLVY